ncbi:hypothetical protein GPJ56_006071 [Histomonas meleagridis]|uniref:uncharacterized protein n=1 Tax=Histomonas meleagridis TaxID=135588 RepID=UPI00355A549A|nr:hypothetical protein GPJ56_006071 [Histomonas meleagridis]KAH0807179.1 hypothetical protein GO595_000355 [Histomonas meleagridis]
MLLEEANVSRNAFICSEGEPKMAYVVTLSVYSVFFYVCFLISITTIIRVCKITEGPKFSALFFRFFFSFTLFVKATLLSIHAYSYNYGKDVGAWKSIVLFVPGSIASICYLVILHNWCGIYGKYIGGTKEKIFNYVKILIIIFVVVFASLSFTFILLRILSTDDDEKFQFYDRAEGVNAMVRDSLSTVLFLVFSIYIGRGLGISCKLCSGTQEQLIYSMSITVCCGYTVRVITRLFYRIFVETGKYSECSAGYLIVYLLKDLFGQCLPLGFVTITDFMLVPLSNTYRSVLDNELSEQF